MQMDNAESQILDLAMGQIFSLNAFMLQVSLELARSQPDPQAWAKRFVSALYAQVDANEERMGPQAMRHNAHAFARQNLDQIAVSLQRSLSPPPTSGSRS
jgi:hypothetical protein